MIQEPTIDSISSNPVVPRSKSTIITKLNRKNEIFEKVIKLMKKPTILRAITAMQSRTSGIFKGHVKIRNKIIGTSLVQINLLLGLNDYLADGRYRLVKSNTV
jgi:hypothetical protein